MQKKIHWYFLIDTRFCVVDGRTYVSVKPSKQEEPKRFLTWRRRLCNYNHTWNFNSTQENFTYFKRLTLILSNFLLVYVLVLSFQALPTWEMSDVLDFEYFYYGVDTFFIGFGVSIISYLVHNTITFIFRWVKLFFTKA